MHISRPLLLNFLRTTVMAKFVLKPYADKAQQKHPIKVTREPRKLER